METAINSIGTEERNAKSREKELAKEIYRLGVCIEQAEIAGDLESANKLTSRFKEIQEG